MRWPRWSTASCSETTSNVVGAGSCSVNSEAVLPGAASHQVGNGNQCKRKASTDFMAGLLSSRPCPGRHRPIGGRSRGLRRAACLFCGLGARLGRWRASQFVSPAWLPLGFAALAERAGLSGFLFINGIVCGILAFLLRFTASRQYAGRAACRRSTAASQATTPSIPACRRACGRFRKSSKRVLPLLVLRRKMDHVADPEMRQELRFANPAAEYAFHSVGRISPCKLGDIKAFGFGGHGKRTSTRLTRNRRLAGR